MLSVTLSPWASEHLNFTISERPHWPREWAVPSICEGSGSSMTASISQSKRAAAANVIMAAGQRSKIISFFRKSFPREAVSDCAHAMWRDPGARIWNYFCTLPLYPSTTKEGLIDKVITHYATRDELRGLCKCLVTVDKLNRTYSTLAGWSGDL